jgi:hypothetical protein
MQADLKFVNLKVQMKVVIICSYEANVQLKYHSNQFLIQIHYRGYFSFTKKPVGAGVQNSNLQLCNFKLCLSKASAKFELFQIFTIQGQSRKSEGSKSQKYTNLEDQPQIAESPFLSCKGW